MTTGLNTSACPQIALSMEDHRQLSALARAAENTMPDLAAELAEEVARARVLTAGERGDGFVGMNDEVEFRDDVTGTVRRVTLVYPQHADIALGRISVMTPVGAALIGLPRGGSIAWETPSGEQRQLTVLDIRAVAQPA
jgi:regulator of nucleoside diphosphate kinase